MGQARPRSGAAEMRGPTGDEVLKEAAIARAEARGLEETFTDRFELGLRRVGEVINPLDGRAYPITSGSGPRTFDSEAKVAERMQDLKVFERDVLGEMPRNRMAVVRLHKTGFLASRATRVIIAAISRSPIEEMILEGSSSRKLDLAEMNEAVDDIVKQEGIFYFLGLLSTTGWAEDCRGRLPHGPNYLVAAVENLGGSRWGLEMNPDRRWGRVLAAFDPETRPEKLARCKAYFADHSGLSLRGGHVVLRNAREEVGVPEDIFRLAVQDAVRHDPQLQRMVVDGKEILKRRRV